MEGRTSVLRMSGPIGRDVRRLRRDLLRGCATPGEGALRSGDFVGTDVARGALRASVAVDVDVECGGRVRGVLAHGGGEQVVVVLRCVDEHRVDVDVAGAG